MNDGMLRFRVTFRAVSHLAADRIETIAFAAAALAGGEYAPVRFTCERRAQDMSRPNQLGRASAWCIVRIEREQPEGAFVTVQYTVPQPYTIIEPAPQPGPFDFYAVIWP